MGVVIYTTVCYNNFKTFFMSHGQSWHGSKEGEKPQKKIKKLKIFVRVFLRKLNLSFFVNIQKKKFPKNASDTIFLSKSTILSNFCFTHFCLRGLYQPFDTLFLRLFNSKFSLEGVYFE